MALHLARRRLKELGLYGPLAIEWRGRRGGAFRAVSVGLVASALGARAAHGCGMAWARECAGAAASVCGGAEREGAREGAGADRGRRRRARHRDAGLSEEVGRSMSMT